jgi:DNA modification methylase
MEWPADRVERRPVADLIPYARNARTHSDEQVAQIAAAIKEWGWTVPVLCDEDGGIIAGHGRVLAARKLQIAEIPVMTAAGWTEAQKRAYIIADNKLTLNAGWDTDLLKVELLDLQRFGFDLAMTGFNADEIADLTADLTVGLTDPDAAPPAPVNPVSALGDVWIMGRHRILCGDSTIAADVGTVLAGEQPHLMVTDPPYGVDYDPNWRNEADRHNGKPFGARALGRVENDDRADWTKAWRLFPGSVAYVWHAGLHSSTVGGSLADAGLVSRAQIVWVKQRPALSRGAYHWQHEAAFYATKDQSDDAWQRFEDDHATAAYAVKKGAAANWRGGRKQSTVWFIENVKNDTGHGTQKPVECMKRPIENNSTPGQPVYEPFSGSGTTIIAAEMTGRCCYAIELSPAYVDVAVKRWQDFTGKQAILEAGGRAFGDLKNGRKAKKTAA